MVILSGSGPRVGLTPARFALLIAAVEVVVVPTVVRIVLFVPAVAIVLVS